MDLTQVHVVADASTIEGAAWEKSRRSNPSGNCAEVALMGDIVAVRHSKNKTGPALIFTGPEWDALVSGVKDGDFDWKS